MNLNFWCSICFTGFVQKVLNRDKIYDRILLQIFN